MSDKPELVESVQHQFSLERIHVVHRELPTFLISLILQHLLRHSQRTKHHTLSFDNISHEAMTMSSQAANHNPATDFREMKIENLNLGFPSTYTMRVVDK